MDPKLFEYATKAETKYLKAVEEAGTMRGASRKLLCAFSTVQDAIERVKRKAAVAGYAPEHDLTHPVPAPYMVKGTSTLYNEEGKVSAQWVKTKLDDAKVQEALQEWVEWLVRDAKGIVKATPTPKHSNADLLTAYVMGDPHFGMYAWAAESGEDFDADIAEKITKAAIDRLVASSPPSDIGLIVELGDFFHADSSANTTPRNNNALDVDTRWARVMQIGLRAMKYVIQRTLDKHAKVVVWIEPGNHDPHSSFALALALSETFSNEPRVLVDLTPAMHRYLRFGNVLIGSTHGDTTPMRTLPGVMAADKPEDWGQTRYRYWYCGHIHHTESKEFPGVSVEYFRTLAPLDAWSASKGFRSGRDMAAIVHHREYGEIERHRCDVAMLT